MGLQVYIIIRSEASNFALFAEVKDYYAVSLRKFLFKIMFNLCCDVFKRPFAVAHFKN